MLVFCSFMFPAIWPPSSSPPLPDFDFSVPGWIKTEFFELNYLVWIKTAIKPPSWTKPNRNKEARKALEGYLSGCVCLLFFFLNHHLHLLQVDFDSKDPQIPKWQKKYSLPTLNKTLCAVGWGFLSLGGILVLRAALFHSLAYFN